MKAEKRRIITSNYICIRGSQALIEGILRLPSDMEQISSIIAVEGIAEVTDCIAADERVSITGTARYNILYIDKKGEVCAFDSECMFKHIAEDERIKANMQIFADVDIQNSEYRLVDGANIEMKSLLCVDIHALGNNDLDIVGNVCDDAGIEVLRDDVNIPRLTSAKNVKSYIKNEYRVPQNMPPVKKILMQQAYASVDEIHSETEKIIVGGSLRFFIVYLSADKKAPIQCITDAIQIEEIVSEPMCSADSLAKAAVHAEQLMIDKDENDEDILKIHAVVSIKTYCYENEDVKFIKDIYSIDKSINAERRKIEITRPAEYTVQKRIVRLGISVPAMEQDVSRVLFANGTVQIADVRADGANLQIEGILSVSVCYTTSDAGIKSFKEQIPFESILQADEAESVVSANVEYINVEGSGRDLDVKFGVEFKMMSKNKESIYAVCEVEESEESIEREKGIIVYITEENETLWDIAKRFRVPKSIVLKMNKEISDDTLGANEKIIIMA